MAIPRQDDPVHQDQYDIFDSSPQRPLNVYGGALVNDSVDALVSQDGIINSNHKREFPNSSPSKSPSRSPYNDNTEHGSKRHRTANWPLSEDESTPRKSRTPRKSNDLGNNDSASRRHVSTPGRPSRFLEGSMRDYPSNKPPSAFTRHFNAQLDDASVDQLMDDYHEAEKPLPDRPPPHRFATRSPAKSPQRIQHQNVSTWSSSTGGSNELEQEVATPKPSGLFRFGKSMASAFNPVSIWKKVATTFQDTKEEMIQEKMQEKMDDRYGDSREKAEQAYAVLKAAGKLGAQGSTPISRHVRVYAPGYSSEVDPQKQRDSGISMDDESRSSMDTGKLAPAMGSARKASWHSRTPSLQNLKKIASMGNLHKRSTSGTRSISPEKDHNDGFGSLRRSSSKLELKKQHKLSKRVSDLEVKLNAARRELDSALAVPIGGSSRSRSVTPIHPLPQVPNEDVDIHHGAPRSARHGGGWQRRYNPALPTLLSERLLPAEGFMDDDSSPSRPVTGSFNANTLDAIESEVNDAPIRGITDGRFYMQPNEQLQPTFTFTAAKSDALEPEAIDVDNFRPITPKESISFLADPSSSPQKMDIEVPPPVPEKPTPRKKVVIKRKNVDTTYRPRRQEFEEDTDLEEEKPKSLKKKQVGDENSPKTKKQRASRVPISTSPNTKKPKVLSKAQPALPVQKILEQVQILEDEIQPRCSLETVLEHEEITTTTTVTVKDAPSRPTARATPAHPSRARFDRSRSRSRSRSPRKTFGTSTSTNLNSRERRSASPPPSSTIGKEMGMREIESPVVTARPNGRDVPPMPVMGKLEKKESFEWPDDVF